jgi:hypothetical protein
MRSDPLRTKTIPAKDVRIPEPVEGEIVVVERYGKTYAAIIDGEDLALFQRMLAMFGSHQPSELLLSDAALRAHEASESGDDVEEFDFDLLDTHPNR